ncbi:MAG: DHHA1 domain-containing protein, partial [Chloroflexota bacterium]
MGRLQEFVNEKIRQALKVSYEQMPYKKAIEAGTIALFDEKYGDTVRVLRIGKPPISAELCGGTHAGTTGEIGFFHILSESSIGAGLRRIEAVTGRGAEKYFNQRLLDLEKVAGYLETKPDEVVTQAQNLAAELKNARKRTQAMERELAKLRAEALVSQAETVNGIKVLAANVPSSRIEALLDMSDLLNDKLKSVVIVLGTVYEDKPLFLATVTPDLVAKGYDAGKIVMEAAKVAGGGGGGKATLAQAGGRDKSRLDEALGQVKRYIQGVKF